MALSPFDPFALQRWDPFREMTAMREAMNRMLQSNFTDSGEAGIGVSVDVRETDDDYRIEASLPGVKPEDVRLSIHGNMVTIEGERKESHERRDGERVTYSEHRQGRFARTFSLSQPVDPSSSKAEFHDGMLCVTLPKTEAARPRQIPISQTAGNLNQAASAGIEARREEVSPGSTEQVR